MKKFLGFDIGGTKIAYALIDEKGKLLSERTKYDTPKTSSEIFKLLKSIVSQYETDISAVAIATAGEVDLENSRIISSVGNMAPGYQHTKFSELSSKPVIVENDANAVVYAEYKKGIAKGLKNVIVVAIGTGVGLGIIVNGQLLKGKSGGGAEAHFPVNRGQKRRCSCGAYDCYEIYASGTALGLDAKEAFHDDNMTSHELIRLMKENNPQAITVFNDWQKDVMSGIYGLASLFDPDMVILFGSLVEYLDIPKMEKEANSLTVASPFELRAAEFGHNAAMVGAVLLAAEKLKKQK